MGRHFCQNNCRKSEIKGKSCTITASTGISAAHYGNLGATTLHKFAGILNRRFSNTEIIELVSSDERYIETKERLVKTEVLIVDEVSMISNKVMSQVEFLCRKVRKINHLFGNMQVILMGDFYQLPPVSNEMYGDLHTIVLRQSGLLICSHIR